MAWRHYEARQSGECEVQNGPQDSLAQFEIGIVETGRTRVFAGHFVRLVLKDGEQITGEHEYSLRGALWRLARNIAPLGYVLNCAGISAEFNESGLSVDTGWGYWGHQKEPIHMMDPLPADAEDSGDLDQMIREAVEGMQIDISLTLEPAPHRPVRGAPRKAGRGRAAPLSDHRAPSANREPAYSVRNAPRTPQ